MTKRRQTVSNPDKILFPDAGLGKRDLVRYYERIAPITLPHWRDRPLTMHRFPDGIGEEGFYQKNRSDYFPDWIESIELDKEDGTVDHVLVNDTATLLYLADQACIGFHLALTRTAHLAYPDRLVFDLDPSDADFARVQTAAARLRKALDGLELASFVQTTGSRGLHVVVPIEPTVSFDAARDFARRLAGQLAERHPGELTIAQRKKQRGKAVFIDYLRNARGQTSVAPYSLRPLPGAPVATPLRWHEALASGLEPRRYTLRNLFRRLGQTVDPWQDIDRHAGDLGQAAARLDAGAGH